MLDFCIPRGLIHGRPDPTTPQTLIVTDVFPLPIEGFETRVVADDGDVVNHMIALGESLESTRKEKFSEYRVRDLASFWRNMNSTL